MIFHCSTLLHVCCRHSLVSPALKAAPPGRVFIQSFHLHSSKQYNSLCVSPNVIVENHSTNEILRFRAAPKHQNATKRPVSPNVRRAEQAELRLQPQEDGRDLQVHELLGQLIGDLLQRLLSNLKPQKPPVLLHPHDRTVRLWQRERVQQGVVL